MCHFKICTDPEICKILERHNRSLTFDLDNCRRDLKQCETGKSFPITDLTPPTSLVKISREELEADIRAACGDCQIFLPDKVFDIATVNDMRLAILEAAVHEMDFIPERQDCDDFTRKLKGLLVCPGWSGTPALDVWFVHPQIGPHSQFLTDLRDENGVRRIYLIEGQVRSADAFELAIEMFEDNPPWVIKQ